METPSPNITPDESVAIVRKHQAKKKLIFLGIGLLVVAGIAIYLKNFTTMPFQNIASFENSLTSSVQQDFTSFPDPLKASSSAPKKSSMLTRAGVIADTNTQRQQNGNLPALAENVTLDDIATLRLDDMFENQYFAHVSPTGESAVTVASSVGYDHLALGENLAEGIFAGDSGVVTAWMNSPGHRANILSTHYTQIGVAVRLGTVNGQQTWIAVQVFGRPASDCTNPDDKLKDAIDTAQTQLTQMESNLQAEKASIEAMQPQSGDAYNASVEQYNDDVVAYNTLATQTKTEIGQYNDEVNTFNACLAE